MSDWASLETPCLILDKEILQRNIQSMAKRSAELGIKLRPHLKTPKSVPIARALQAAGAEGFTVSTLQEAEFLFEAGFNDIFYAVPAERSKMPRAIALLKAGCQLSLLADNHSAAKQISDAAATACVRVPIWVEIDVDQYRTGIDVDTEEFVALIKYIGSDPWLSLAGIMSYAGASYGCDGPGSTAALTEMHRQALLHASTRVVALGYAPPRLSFGSTPAVLHAETLSGIHEARCGIYVFQDLFQTGIGACEVGDIAVSVLATVIGHSAGLNRFTIDAGGLALSKDRSTQGRDFDARFGLVCDASTCAPIGDLQVMTVSQEIGLVSSPAGKPIDLTQFPIGSRVRVLPNHADMTAAAYEEYHVIESGRPIEIWRRTNRWH